LKTFTITANQPPTISGTARTPSSPTASTPVWVTSTITDDVSVGSASLTYIVGSGTGTQSTVFTETFGTNTTQIKPWTGGNYANNTWTVTGSYCELATNCNYDTLNSSAEGLTYKGQGTANTLADAMIATASGINAAGASGYVQFYLLEDTLSGTDGWAMQTDPTGTGSSYTTRLSDSTFAQNGKGWVKYQYALTSSELVNGLKLRFQFSGGGSGDTGRIFLDDITVTTTSTGTTTTTVPMVDDGAHGDGTAGDHVYGVQIPVQASGTTVNYYVTATDGTAQTTKDPANAPTSTYSYTVSNVNTAPTVATAASAAPSTVTGTTTALSVLGADADTGESSLTYTWAATSIPTGATAPTFSANGANAAKNTTATFSLAGSYTFQATITDPGGLTATSSVTVTVNQTLTSISASPSPTTVNITTTKQFTATGKDQFGTALSSQPTFTWATTVTGGSVSSSGMFTAPSSTGSGTVTATSGSVVGSSTVTVASTPPTISGTATTPAAPTSVSGPYVTSTITDLGSIASATLTYSYVSTLGTQSTPFTETFGSTAAKPWTGSTSSNNTWTVTGSYCELATNCNYDTLNSSTCGLTYKGQGTANTLTGAMLATASGINAAGTAGYVQFYLQEDTLTGTDGWAFQTSADGGTIWNTRLSDSTFAQNGTGWQKYQYTLTSAELVNGLKLRFQFSGGGSGDTGRIFLDDVTVNVTSSGTVTQSATMYDDGAHGDGAAGDHVYGAQIPVQAAGTTVNYYVTATDNAGLTSKDPAAAPTVTYSYTDIAGTNHAPTVATAAAATPSTVTATTTALSVLGADADTGESSLTYTWVATSKPTGATAPTFSANGTNAAKNATATFTQAGNYTFQAMITDPGGLTATSSVTVTVSQTLTSVTVSPASAILNGNGTQQFTAMAKDQFGTAFTTQPTFTWATTVSGGTISASGLFTAPAGSASGSVTATSGSMVGSGSVTVASTLPTFSGTSQTPATVTSTSAVWITSTVTAAATLNAVNLIYNAGSGAVTVPMYDDGSHQDGTGGDHVYGAQIPAFAAGTTVKYCLSATDSNSNTTVDPAIEPSYLYSYTVGLTAQSIPQVNAVPAGSFVMGDHFSFVDPDHTTDELPLHTVSLSAFAMGKFDITDQQYCDYLNSAMSQGLIQVTSGLVYGAGTTTLYCETRQGQLALYATSNPPLTTPYSGISWNGSKFSVISGYQNMPMVGVYWEGAAAYCNWLSATEGYSSVYNLTTWAIDYTKTGYRLPTEAEWEYAANGGNTNPYYEYTWGNDPNTDGTYANTLGSGSPWAGSTQINLTGAIYPWTTPVGFYDGTLHLKTDYNWPGSMTSYQTSNAINGYGLYDMGGDVWQWTNDWYAASYYSTSPTTNPTGPTSGDLMADGKAYRNVSGGSWAQDVTKTRISNRDPVFFRQPLNNTYASVGFRIVFAGSTLVQPGASLTTLATGLGFGEGPASDASGNVYFSDIQANTINKWPTAGQLSVFQSNSGGANGLLFDQRGNLIACQGTNGQIVSISPQGEVTVLASQYNGKRFNEPNDLWIDSLGGIYFTDPVFFGTQFQDVQGVYYIGLDRSTVTRVIGDLTQPNGLIGTADGKTLYVSDWSAGATFKYTVNSDGTLSGKTLFAPIGSDGMEIDAAGNVYMCVATPTNEVVIYNSSGTQIGAIATPERPTNLCFGNADKRTLFITTQHALYSIGMTEQGVTVDGSPRISNSSRSITSPTSTDAPWVTTKVLDDGTVSSVKLSYTIGGTGLPTNAFTETMAATPTSGTTSWTGTGANNAWTVTVPSGQYVAQTTQANYGSGNACGLQFKGGDTTLADTMITTTNGINVAGTAATVQFYLQTPSVSTSESWTFQISADGGTSWATCLSETNSKHGWSGYSYTLTSAQLVSSMKMRFQFEGNGSTDSVYLDDITVTATFGTTTLATMYDDGLHSDGTAGDGVYGAQIPAQASAAVVCYHIIATDNTGLSSTDPASSSAYYSYTVSRAAPTVQINELLANPTAFTATTDYSTQTVGVFSNTANAYPGYTIIDPMMGKTTYLIDNTGQVVHSWTSEYTPGRASYLLPNGHLIRMGSVPNPPMNTGGGEGGIIEERDWDGNLVWSYSYATTTYMCHHDFRVLPNGDVLMLVVEVKTYADCIAAGFNPSLLQSTITTGGLQVDSLVEVKPNYTTGNTGTIIWQWHVWDHLVQSYDSSKSNYGVVAAHPELIDANGNCGGGTQIIQFWNHANGIDYNATLDQIIISSRNQSEVWIIDHSTTTAQAASHTGGAHNKGGDLLYRWGNPQEYGAGTAANEMLFQQHNATWIPAGYPGAGDILVFSNGENRPGGNYSSVDEFTPPVDANGNYALTTSQAYGPATETWNWKATPPTSFYNTDVGGAERLPNGDTMICYGQKGEAWEVNAAGQIVWDYQDPISNSTALYQGDTLPADPQKAGGYLTAFFRCERYPLSYAAFAGRTLTPSGTIEQYRDVIELRNTGSSAVDLGGMYLTNDLSTLSKWQIPTGTSIAAGGYLLFYADGQTSATTASGRHTSFTLSPGGGTIALIDINGVTPIDTITYGAQTANVSYGRAANGSLWGPMASPTLGTSNGTITTAVAFSGTATGTYGGTTSIAATLTEGGSPVANETIRFTLNGTLVGTATTNSSGIATLSGASLAGIHVGSYATALAAAFLGDSVYAANSVTGVLSVTAAPLTITADSKSKVYGAAVPVLTASYSGLVNGDTSASLTTLPTLSTTATSNSSVGTYTITASGAVDPDYSISYATGTLTVTSDPTVAAMLVANGLTERSYVDQLTFQFSKPVSSSMPVPMTLTDFGTAGTLNHSVALTSSQFQWTTVPGSGNSVLTWSLESFAGGTSSLPDGFYQLRLSSSAITDAYGLPLDGDGDGQPGGDYVMTFFVLQGDANGDGTVNNNDMLVVNAALGSLTGASNWNPNADLNRSGTVTTSDRILVYNNLGNSITPPSGLGSQVAPAVPASLPEWSFGGVTQQTIANGLPAGSPVSGITFGAGAGAIVLGGNAVELNGDVTNQGPNTQAINLPLTLIGGNRTIDTSAGNVTIAGGIDQNGGSFGIIKTGPDTLVLSGANTYSGGTVVNEGTLIVTAANALPDGTSLTIGSGATLVFDPTASIGSTLAVTGASSAQVVSATVASSQTKFIAAALPMDDTKALAGTIARTAAKADRLHSSATLVQLPMPKAYFQPPVSCAIHSPAPLPAPRCSTQAHDAVLKSSISLPLVEKTKVVPFWIWDNPEANKRRSLNERSVDAVMTMLQRM